jgi:hypothetical protein
MAQLAAAVRADASLSLLQSSKAQPGQIRSVSVSRLGEVTGGAPPACSKSSTRPFDSRTPGPKAAAPIARSRAPLSRRGRAACGAALPR